MNATTHPSLMPAWLPGVNRRVVNPVQRLWAPWLPPLAMVHHVGRVSGTPHANPVLAFRHGDTVAIPLVYGSQTQWLRNLRAARRGELVRGGRRVRIGDLHVVTDPAAAPPLSATARALLRRVPLLVARVG